MADSESKEIQVKPKQELTATAEQTRPGLVFTPSVDIFETDNELVLLADMPGVSSDGITIDLREDTLTLTGEAVSDAAEGESALLTEYETGKYYRQFSLSSLIDQEKIDANLTDGVLRLSLAKVEKATPRKIEVKAG
jgi:HSP20 family molecular chaperone IbpA